MESAMVIKVKYGDTLRRFNALIDENDALALNMDGLRAKIIGLFNFPPDAQFTMTYIDEDGDRVTLVDDDDLRDAIRQCLKFLRIDVQLNSEKSGKTFAKSSGTSTPLRSPHGQSSLPNLNSGLPEALKSLPEPLLESLSKLSLDLTSKVLSSSNPVFADIIQRFSKMGHSGEESSSQAESFESHDAPLTPKEPKVSKDRGLTELLAKSAASNTSSKSHHDVDLNASRGMGGPALVDLNIPPSCFPLNGTTSASLGPVEPPKHSKKTKKVVSNGSSSYNTCPFSGTPLVNDSAGTNTYPQASPMRSNYRDALVGMFHKGIRCDGCGVFPITGPRFKSKVKEDYDLCSICFAEMGSDADYIRIDRPVHHRRSRQFKTINDQGMPQSMWFDSPIAPHFGSSAPYVLRGCGFKPVRPKLDSRFVSDVNVLDGTVMAPSTRFTKIWRMRNCGTMSWPRGTHLVWIGGDRLSDAFTVEIGLPAEGVPIDGELDIAVDFTAPESPGRYISYWRMATPAGVKFGQRVWVLIQIDGPLLEPENICDSKQGFNLNLPPEGDVSRLPQTNECSTPKLPMIIDMNVAPPGEEVFLDACSSSYTVPEPVKPVVVEPPRKEQDSVVDGSLLINPGVPQLSVPPPAAVSSTVTYPIIDLTTEPLVTPLEHPSVTVVTQVPKEVTDKEAVENALLKELEDMGFSQVNLNREILRMNEYDLERSVDELCGVADWDPILEELNEMGFHDEERNRRLLVKNNGSIKRVVMDLLTSEKA